MNTGLSKASQAFLEDLRLYLIAGGKGEREIEEIVQELEDHLTEAEAHGKSVDQLTGGSPKHYMEQLSKEMKMKKRTVFSFIAMILFGVLSYMVLTEAAKGKLAFSMVEIIGMIIVCILFLFTAAMVLRGTAASGSSKKKEFFYYFLLSILPILLFIGVILLDRSMVSPEIHFGSLGTALTAVVMLGILLWLSYWTRTWVLAVVLACLVLPDFLLRYTNMQEQTKLALSSTLTFAGILVYLFVVNKQLKKE